MVQCGQQRECTHQNNIISINEPIVFEELVPEKDLGLCVYGSAVKKLFWI